MDIERQADGAPVLVAYASKHGATQEIAERIADRLRSYGLESVAKPVTASGDLNGYSAFVIGSAVYLGSWMKDATAFFQRHRDVLAERPVWLFSSGPLGTSPTDDAGHELKTEALPKQTQDLDVAIAPREHRVFFGVLDPATLGLAERAMRKLPAGRQLLPEGDFRDWSEIEAWADGIATVLTQSALDDGMSAATVSHSANSGGIR